MGVELETHDGRIKKLERLEGQVRLLQGVALAVLIFVGGIFWDSCQARDVERVEEAGIKVKLESHLMKPHDNVCEAGIETVNGILLDYGERIRMIEGRLHIRKKR